MHLAGGKVLNFITSLGFGGAERLFVTLLPRLKALGVDVVAVSLNDDVPLRNELDKHGIRLHCLGHRGTIYSIGAAWNAIRKLRAVVAVERPAIVHSHLYLADIYARLAVPRNVRLVTTLHSIDPWWAQGRRIRSVLKTKLDGALSRARDVHFISVSEEVWKASTEQVGIDAHRNAVIRNGIDVSGFPLIPGIDPGNRTVIQVGRFYPEKGHSTSLKAFALLEKDFPNSRLIFIGDGPRREDLQLEARNLGLNGVVFQGATDNVAQELAKASVFWMPSEWEGLGIACIEAMACGLPVVASGVGGLPELIHDRETGFLIAQGDHRLLAEKTQLLWSDPDLARAMGAKGRERVVTEFSVDSTARAYSKLYDQILQE